MPDDSDQLRRPVVRAMERLVNDLTVGRHDDPHLAFVVFQYPDRHPEIVSLSHRGLCAFRRLVSSDDPKASVREPRRHEGERDGGPFTWGELSEAGDALNSALSVGRYDFRYRREGQTLGEVLDEGVRERWQRRRDIVAERELAAEAEAIRRPIKCPFCRNSFTPKGWPMHVQRAPYCRQQWRRAFRSVRVFVGLPYASAPMHAGGA